MTWRRQVPVLSPVPYRALADGARAAIGVDSGAHDVVRSALQSRYGAADVLLTDSGTSALTLALRQVVNSGGTVAYPAYACIDLTTAALGAGVKVRLYDLDPATLSPDLGSVRAAIRRGVDAIVVAHLYGYPADVIGVRELAAEHGIAVIEDAAQGAGGTLRGRLLGSLGDVAILSFARGKGTTGGSGGALLVKNPALAEWITRTRPLLQRGLRDGMEVVSLVAQRLLSNPHLYSLPAAIPGLQLGKMVYRPPRQPRAMSAVSAAILRWTLASEPQEVSLRRARAKNILFRARAVSGMMSVCPILGGESGFLRLAVIDNAGIRFPRPDLGVVRGYPMTLDQHPQLWPLLLSGERAGKGAQLLRDGLLTVPTHAHVDASDLRRLAGWLDSPQTGSQLFAPAS